MSAAIALRSLAPVALIGALSAGCATGNRELGRDHAVTVQGSPPVSAAASSRAHPNRIGDLLTAGEIASMVGAELTTLHETIARLRPVYLHPRQVRSTSIPHAGVLPVVFINGNFFGPAEALRSIPVSQVAEVQFIRPVQAMHRYGPDYGAGIISVRLKR